MVNGSENDPVAPGQLPLAELVAGRRQEKGLTLAAVARLMRRAAEQDGDYSLASRQAIHDYERGRIPYYDSLRWLASALQLSFEEALAAAQRQRAHRQLLRAADSIRGDAAGSPSPAGPAWERLILEAAARHPGDNKNVHRRQVLFDLAMLGLAAPLAGVEAVRQGLAAALFGDGHAAHVDEWEAIVHEYARSFYVTPTDRLLRDLTADLSVLQRRLGETDGAVQRSLARVAAQLAATCAVAWRDAGEPRQAGRWWRTAHQLADRSGDTEVRTWVSGEEVTSGLYEQRPFSVILDRAAVATTIAGPLASAGSAQLYGGLAQTLAMTGRDDEALAALARVADLTDRLPARVVADEGMLGWPEVRLRHTQSYVHTWLGNTGQAYAAQEAALNLYPESFARERAKMRLHRTACMIQDGDVGGGLAYAGRVLDGLPAQHHTESLYALGRAVMRVLPEQERGRPEAAELRARLACSPAGQY